MVVQLRRVGLLNKIYIPRGVDFCSPISKSSLGTPVFYFVSWVYIYWITSVQTFTEIWMQVLFGWNDLNNNNNNNNNNVYWPWLCHAIKNFTINFLLKYLAIQNTNSTSCYHQETNVKLILGPSEFSISMSILILSDLEALLLTAAHCSINEF